MLIVEDGLSALLPPTKGFSEACLIDYTARTFSNYERLGRRASGSLLATVGFLNAHSGWLFR